MFDIGFPELVVIAIVALIVLGPERLPKVARFAGLWVRRARAQWHSVKDELERELAADELKRSLRDTEEALRETERKVRESAAETEREFDDLRASVKAPASASTPESPEPSPAADEDDAPLSHGSSDEPRRT
ncbi:Sec-independent protein translocase protein TatB [Pseudoxanthomonas beigongshangi]